MPVESLASKRAIINENSIALVAAAILLVFAVFWAAFHLTTGWRYFVDVIDGILLAIIPIALEKPLMLRISTATGRS